MTGPPSVFSTSDSRKQNVKILSHREVGQKDLDEMNGFSFFLGETGFSSD